MKKFFLNSVAIILLTIIFTGCNEKQTAVTTNPTNSYKVPNTNDEIIELVDTLDVKMDKVDRIVTSLAIGNNFDTYTSKTGVSRKIDSIRFLQKNKELIAIKKKLPNAVLELKNSKSIVEKLNPDLLVKLDKDRLRTIERSTTILDLGNLYLKD